VNGAETFIRVLEKYRLRSPVPREVRAGMGRARKETLRLILRERGDLSTGVLAVLPLFRALRGLGMPVTFRQGRMISSALAAAVVCALFVGVWTAGGPFLAPERPGLGVVVFAAGDVTRTGKDGVSTSLKARDVLERGDRVRTGDGATAVVQAGETIMVRLMARSELSMDTLLGAPAAEVSIFSGTVLAKVNRLAKGQSFSVKTPTVVASVRGTAFSVTAGDADTVVVTEGAVAVTGRADGRERLLRAVSAVSGRDLAERAATGAERLGVDRVGRLTFVKNPLTAPQSDFDALAELVRKTDGEIDAEIRKLQGDTMPQTLQEIRAKYGRIDVVRLFNGETVRGAIVGRGATMKLLVPGRYRVIPAGAVRETGTE